MSTNNPLNSPLVYGTVIPNNTPTPQYYKDLKERGFLDDVESAIISFVQYIPGGNWLWGKKTIYNDVKPPDKWKSILESKKIASPKPNDYDESVYIRSIWNIRNIVDAITFKFLLYIDEEGEENVETNMKDRWAVANTNIAIVAALVLSICYTFLQQFSSIPISPESGLAYWYIFSWTTSISWCVVTVGSSVLTLIAMEETGSVDEAVYFLKLFSVSTYDIGPLIPVTSFAIALMTGGLGLLLWFFIFLDSLSAVICCGLVIMIFTIFVTTYFSMVSALHSAREQSKFVAFYQKNKVTITKLNWIVFMNDFIRDELNGNVSELPAVDDFLLYIIDSEKEGIKQKGELLNTVSEIRVRKLYDKYLEHVALFEAKSDSLQSLHKFVNESDKPEFWKL